MIMTRLHLFLIAAFTATLASSAYAESPGQPKVPDKENFKIFLLAGQSNMAGRGDLAEADPAINPRVLMLTKDGSWQYAMDPVHYDKPIAGVGLARSFAATLVEKNEDVIIGLVPSAIGGSPIATWEPGAYHERTNTHPYDDAIARAKRAMQDGTLAGILWHQGEGDSGPAKSAVYEDKLIALVERFRNDLGVPDVPFIIGQLGQFEGKPWSPGRHVVNEAQIAVAKKVPHAGFVSSDGLTSKEDNTHFNSKSLHEFGERYAQIYLRVIGQEK
jgi:hypothetical protein